MDKAEKQRILAELTHFTEEQYDELLSMLLVHAAEKIKELKVALKNDDFPSIAKIAHSLKGTSGSLRVMTLYEPAKSIEAVARETPNRKKIAKDIARLEKALLAL